MKIVFVSESAMELNTGWMNKAEDGKLFSKTICNEKIVVNPATLEIEEAYGYDSFVASLLSDGLVRICKKD